MFNDIISEHFMNPKNVGEIDDPDYVVEINNPVCGDTVHMFLNVDGDQILEVKYLAYGCSTSIATVSILSEIIKKKSFNEISNITREEVTEWLGELEPSQYHCIDIGMNILTQCSNPVKKSLEKREYLVEEEGAFSE